MKWLRPLVLIVLLVTLFYVHTNRRSAPHNESWVPRPEHVATSDAASDNGASNSGSVSERPFSAA